MALRRRGPPVLIALFLVAFCVSVAQAASAVVGIDLGTEYIKATLVKPGIPLDIVLTKDSRRKELSAVAFKPSKKPQANTFPERVYGSDAIALAARFPGDVYPNLKTLLGLSASDTTVKEWAERRPGLKLEGVGERDTVAFRSGAFVPEELPWTVEEILAMELQSIQKNAEALVGKGTTVRDAVITIPPFYTTEEKRAVELAAQLAGLNVLELMNDALAVGLNFATSRTFPSISSGGKAEHHLVFDMGAGSAKATVLKFQGRSVKDVGKFNKTVQEVIVMGSGWDRGLSGDALNGLIVDNMVSQFVDTKKAKALSTTPSAVKRHGRAAAQLWKEAERLRQVLSANINTQASFEGLYEDIDFRYKITRDQFEKLAEPYLTRVGLVVQQALEAAHLEVKDLDSVILHGGASRTPFVQKALEKFVGDGEKVRTNVNADEAAAFGAGFRAAGISPSFRVKEIRCYDAPAYDITVKWTDGAGLKHEETLWAKSKSQTGATKKITMQSQKELSIDIYQHVRVADSQTGETQEKLTHTVTSSNLTETIATLVKKFECAEKDVQIRLGTRLAKVNGELEIVNLVAECESDGAAEKGSVVDSVKGIFGFGKKDQAPLVDDESPEVADEDRSSVASDSSKTSKSSASPSSQASKDGSEVDNKGKPTKRIESIPIKISKEVKGFSQQPTADVTRMKERLIAFDNSDRTRRLREDALNQLEGYTYKVRELLIDEDIMAVSLESDRKVVEAKVTEISDWLDSEGANAAKDVLKEKLKKLKSMLEPMETRKQEAATRPENILKLQDALNATSHFIDTIKSQIKNDTIAHSSFSASLSSAATATSESSEPVASGDDDEFADLDDEDEASTRTSSAAPEKETLPPPMFTDEDVKKLQELLDTATAWLADKLEQQEKLSPDTNPVLLSKDLIGRAQVLQDATFDLVMKGMKGQDKGQRSQSAKPKKGKSTKSKTNKTKTTATEVPPAKSAQDKDEPLEDDLLERVRQAQLTGKPGSDGRIHVEL